MGHPLFGPHTPFLTLNVENKYSAHISVTYSRYVISLVEIHQVVSEESHRTNERTNGWTNGRNSWILYTPRFASGGYNKIHDAHCTAYSRYDISLIVNSSNGFRRDVDCRVLLSFNKVGKFPILAPNKISHLDPHFRKQNIWCTTTLHIVHIIWFWIKSIKWLQRRWGL